MNAESQWLTKTTDLPVASETRYLDAISNAVSLDALIVGASPYERSSAHKLDALYEDTGTWWPGGGLYADGAQEGSDAPGAIQVFPPVAAGQTVHLRYVADIPDPETNPEIPFPDEFAQALVDGAIATGLARMDERFDSAGYFEARFVDSVGRLRRRRHGRVGRGYSAIRVFAP